jgi:hypothetical protein
LLGVDGVELIFLEISATMTPTSLITAGSFHTRAMGHLNAPHRFPGASQFKQAGNRILNALIGLNGLDWNFTVHA